MIHSNAALISQFTKIKSLRRLPLVSSLFINTAFEREGDVSITCEVFLEFPSH